MSSMHSGSCSLPPDRAAVEFHEWINEAADMHSRAVLLTSILHSTVETLINALDECKMTWLTVMSSLLVLAAVLMVSLAMPLAAVKPCTLPGLTTTGMPCAGVLSGFTTSTYQHRTLNHQHLVQTPFVGSSSWHIDPDLPSLYRDIEGHSRFVVFGCPLEADGVRWCDNLDTSQLGLHHFPAWKVNRGTHLKTPFPKINKYLLPFFL